jgi:hypothetical protein
MKDAGVSGGEMKSGGGRSGERVCSRLTRSVSRSFRSRSAFLSRFWAFVTWTLFDTFNAFPSMI